MPESLLLNCTARYCSSWAKVLWPKIPTAHNLSTPRSPVIDLAVAVSAWPWAEISQRLSHVIGGFPGVFLPMLIYGVFLESSYEQMAVSHCSPDLPISVFSVCLRGMLGSFRKNMRLCFQQSGSAFYPLPEDKFFFFFWIEITVFLSFHFRSVLSPNVSEEPPCLSHRFSLSVLIHCHWINETSLVSLKPTRFSIYLHRLSTERGAGKSK